MYFYWYDAHHVKQIICITRNDYIGQILLNDNTTLAILM